MEHVQAMSLDSSASVAVKNTAGSPVEKSALKPMEATPACAGPGIPPATHGHVAGGIEPGLAQSAALPAVVMALPMPSEDLKEPSNSKMLAWLRANPSEFPENDLKLAEFAAGSTPEMHIKTWLDPRQRALIHERASQMGLQTTSYDYRSAGRRASYTQGFKKMKVVKPIGWTMPDWSAPLPPPTAPPTTFQHKRTRREEWTTDCTLCGAELDVYSAMYGLRGGAHCEECINADPYLQGCKWESKDEFW